MAVQLLRFETLIENYHDEIYGYLWRLLDNAGEAGDTVDAADLAQEVFLRAYKAFARLRPESNHRAWLYKIATNCAYTALKRGRHQNSYSVPLPEDDEQALAGADPLPDRMAALNETLLAVRQVIAVMPTKQRAAVLLRYAQGLDYDEIAQALGCSADSARANVYQAIRRLRRELGPDQSSHTRGKEGR